MAVVPIRIANLLGGVSREAEELRPVNRVKDMANVELNDQTGAEKRPGSQFIESVDGASVNGELIVSEPTNAKKVFWIDRAAGEQFVVLIDPTVSNLDKMIQIFNISDGAERTVLGNGTFLDTAAPAADAVLSDAINLDLRTYLTTGTQDVRLRYKLLAVEDATFLLNRTVITQPMGGLITFQAQASDLRNTAHAQNVSAWSNFEQQPAPTGTFPPRRTGAFHLVTGGPLDDDALWHARDNDVGQDQGFYFAISDTGPPWFQRIRTEPANSMIDEDTMPLRLDFDGTDFVLKPVAWTDRFSGDSTLNPGPSFLTNAISDLVLHQDRLFFLSGEQIVSSRAGDLFNLWIKSIVLRNDADPIDQTVPGGNENRTNTIDFAISIKDALVAMTRGARQVELRANGPLSPNTAFLDASTSLFTVEYISPITMGDTMFMMGERDFANIAYAYKYDPERFGNTAQEITEHVRNYIPAEAAVWAASEQHSQIFVTTDAEKNRIYVYRTEDEARARREQRLPNQSWYRWIFDADNEILSINVFDDFLFVLIRKDSVIFLEKIPLGKAEQDTDTANGPVQGLRYSIPIDRKVSITGVYDAVTDTTEFTLPYGDLTIDELILGPAWDTDFIEPDLSVTKQRLAGMRFQAGINMTVTLFNGQTVLQVDGQFQTNINSNTPLAFAGRSYKKDIHISRVFFRDRFGEIVHGTLQLMGITVRHKDTGFYAVEVTPENRDTITQEFVVPTVGASPLDGPILDEAGEFSARVLSAAHSVEIHITNDSPLPSAIVEIEFKGEFIPSRSPVR